MIWDCGGIPWEACGGRYTFLSFESIELDRKQVIKTFYIREGWWYIGIKGDGGVKSKGTRLLIEKEK